jgi:hypothetical protein
MKTYTETVVLQEVVCDGCGVTFAFPQLLHKGFQRTGKSFYCPNGHTLHFQSEESRLQKQLVTEQDRYRQVEAQLVAARDQLQAAERELARHKKRVANGVCPCCNRSFAQLGRHMKTKHPEYS